MTTTKELIAQLEAACHDDQHFEAPEGFANQEASEWEQDHKWQHNTIIVKHAETNKFFAIDQSRSGSYHTDWDYSKPVVRGEVVQQVVKKTEWVKV